MRAFGFTVMGRQFGQAAQATAYAKSQAAYYDSPIEVQNNVTGKVRVVNPPVKKAMNPQRLPIGKKIKVNYIIVKRDGTVQASVPVKRNPKSTDSGHRFAGERGGGDSRLARKRARMSQLKSLGQYRTASEDREYKQLTAKK